MDIGEANNFIQSETLGNVVDKIVELSSPRRIYLYNRRIDLKKEISSFKLCIVADVADKYAAERDIYLKIDCDIPFDILIYTVREWEDLTASPTTFAFKISETGVVVYNG